MSGDSEWKGHRLGAYQVGERYTDVPEDEGRLYSARHVETGEPALVVMPAPGDAWHGAQPWSTETTRFTQPEALVVHPRSPEGTRRPTLHALTLDFIRIAGALAGLDAREDALNPFHHEPRRSRSSHRAKRWVLAGAGVALATGLALLFWPQVSEQSKTEGSIAESISFSDEEDSALLAIAYKMPEEPFKEQRKPPCRPELDVEIRGGCWIELSRTAPCARGSAEYQGKCYLPVKKLDPPPTSVQP